MKLIGVTGGVGAGKSEILRRIKSEYNCEIIFSDDVANQVKKKGMPAYFSLIELLGKEILCISEDGTYGEIDRGRMASAIFGNAQLLQKVNEILHPATNEFISDRIDAARREGRIDYLFVEAALLIENGYKDIVDEMWYIYASEEIRRNRLKKGRNYSDEKIDRILSSQLSDEEFRRQCDVVIDNSGTHEETMKQIRDLL
jgi:dephospho-CoA kinase